MTVSMHKTVAALRLPTQVPELMGVAEAIIQAMTGNHSFPNPTPSLAAVASALAELSDAQVAARTRTHGTAAARDVKRAALVSLLTRLKAYVQGVADEHPEHAATIIESAGMHVKRSAPLGKAPFAVEHGPRSGSVELVVRSAGDRARYDWQWSLDGGETWNSRPSTLQARTVVSGLPSGSTCRFRYRVLTRTGASDWSEPLSMLVR